MRSAELVAVALGLGILAGVAYTLSPLTLISAALLVGAARWACQDHSRHEMQWFLALLVAAVTLRLAVIAALYLTADPAQPFATFFGDEELFKSRSVWLRNLNLGVAVSPADVIYVFDQTGDSIYISVLGYIQALVGDAQYGVHTLNATLYVISVLALYRLARSAYGQIPAMAGMSLLLFLPTQIVWSMSALKEPLYTLVVVAEVMCAMEIVRARSWWRRVMAAAAVVAAAVALGAIRRGAEFVVLGGVASGLTLGLALRRFRSRVVWLSAAVAVGVGLSVPLVQHQLLELARESAHYHIGHVLTPGHSYKLLDSSYYYDTSQTSRMPARDAAVFSMRSLVSYAVEPLPWRIESAALLAYVPELVVWYLMLMLAPIGAALGWRSQPLLTSLLVTHAAVSMLIVALTGGNTGTLIRHRGLAMPFLVWLAALGAFSLIRWLVQCHRTVAREETA